MPNWCYPPSMEDTRQVFIVGDSLFAETLSQMLASSGDVVIVGAATSPEEALTSIKVEYPDVVIVANTGEMRQGILDPLLNSYPDLPIISADLNQDFMQVITCQRVVARRFDLLAAIAALPKRK